MLFLKVQVDKFLDLNKYQRIFFSISTDILGLQKALGDIERIGKEKPIKVRERGLRPIFSRLSLRSEAFTYSGVNPIK